MANYLDFAIKIVPESLPICSEHVKYISILVKETDRYSLLSFANLSTAQRALKISSALCSSVITLKGTDNTCKMVIKLKVKENQDQREKNSTCVINNPVI